MNAASRILNLVLVSILLSSCASIPESPVGGVITAAPVKSVPAATHLLPSPTALPASQTPPSSSFVQLPESDQVIFTIPNPQPWSGREGDPRPDWQVWGAETFAVAPDATFWIADTAVSPNRLLQYSPQGELLNEISLEGSVRYAYDILVTRDSLWVLDISTQQPRVVQMSLDGEPISSMDIPPEMLAVDGNVVSNAAFGLLPGEGGEILLATLSGYYVLVDTSGEVAAQPLEALTFGGHAYQEGIYNPATRGRPAYLDGAPLELEPDFTVESPLLGFNPDGSFALAGYAQRPDGQGDGQVKIFDAAGDLLGTAAQRPQTFYKDWNHHLAFGPDGAVYQLLSNPDHSVQVLRLGFAETLPPRSESSPPTPTPLAPLPPSTPAETAEAQAQNALISFFADLSSGDYTEAAARFGGQPGEYARPPQPGESLAAYWEYLCAFLWCLPVAEVTDVEQVSENEVTFYTVFMQPDGTRFEIGACCGGDPAATPPVWQFAYPVQKIDEVWKVMRPPLFTP